MLLSKNRQAGSIRLTIVADFQMVNDQHTIKECIEKTWAYSTLMFFLLVSYIVIVIYGQIYLFST